MASIADFTKGVFSLLTLFDLSDEKALLVCECLVPEIVPTPSNLLPYYITFTASNLPKQKCLGYPDEGAELLTYAAHLIDCTLTICGSSAITAFPAAPAHPCLRSLVLLATESFSLTSYIDFLDSLTLPALCTLRIPASVDVIGCLKEFISRLRCAPEELRIDRVPLAEMEIYHTAFKLPSVGSIILAPAAVE
ncbi:hypothetical protein DFH09DRAFT_1270676 [Mycena vulgaris]|nr:hypothetical protein DFH09DRAFT_1270676 [Mycena vulgaris]